MIIAPLSPPAARPRTLLTGPLLAMLAAGGACKPAVAPPAADETAQKRELTDSLFLALSSDREIYTKHVVERLQNEEKVIQASEHWKDDKALPLPAQMFRMAAERLRERTKTFSYALISLDPINRQNRPRTDVEKHGLQALADSGGENQYAQEVLGDAGYFTAIYPDKAVSPACVSCHNSHPDSPRKDYKLGDVMGGVVIRVARR